MERSTVALYVTDLATSVKESPSRGWWGVAPGGGPVGRKPCFWS
jgi:hypothetical protein